MIDQISIFTENKMGATRKVLSVLSTNDINVHGFVNHVSGDFATLRLILSDCSKALELLKAGGYLCNKTQVIGVEFNDTPGELEKMLSRIEDMNINIDYIYDGYRRETGRPILILHSEELDIVADALKKSGYTVY